MKTMKLVALTGEELALLKRILDPEYRSTTLIVSLTDAEGDLATDLLSTLNGVTPDAFADRLIDALQQADVAIDEVLGEDGYEATDMLSCECTFDENRGKQRGKACAHTAARQVQEQVQMALKKIAPSVEEVAS